MTAVLRNWVASEHFYAQLYVIVNSLCDVLAYFLTYCVCGKLFERRVTKKRIIFPVIMVAALWLVAVHHLSGVNFFNALYMLVSFELMCLCLYKVSINTSIIVSFVSCVYGVFLDVIVTVMMCVVMKMNLYDYSHSDKCRTIGCIFIVTLWLLSYKIYSAVNIVKGESVLTAYEVVFIICLTLFQFVIIYLVTLLSGDSNGIILTLCMIGFTIIDFFVVHLMELLSKSYKTRYELEAVKTQNKIQLDHYEELNRRYIETGCMLHDIEKHISAIESLAAENSSEAGKYTAALRRDIMKLGNVFDCSNRLLGAVLSQKISSAEELGISAETDIQNLSLEFMEETDITSVFANLLDNAIEACKEVGGEKVIVLKMQQINELVLISVENTFSGKLSKRGENYRTTKAGHKGLGLTSIRLAVEKYGGYITTGRSGDRFIANVVIPIRA